MSKYERAHLRILSVISRLFGILLFRFSNVSFGKGVTFFGLPIIANHKGSKIYVGNRVVLCSSSVATALGVNHPVILRTLAQNAIIEIGDDVGISGASICAGKHVQIGASSMLGANVIIADTDFHDLSQKDRRYLGMSKADACKPVIIGGNVFLGTNTIVLKGVTIGENSIIGAGSVVTKDIPANVIAVGNPCQVIRRVSSNNELEK